MVTGRLQGSTDLLRRGSRSAAGASRQRCRISRPFARLAIAAPPAAQPRTRYRITGAVARLMGAITAPDAPAHPRAIETMAGRGRPSRQY